MKDLLTENQTKTIEANQTKIKGNTGGKTDQPLSKKSSSINELLIIMDITRPCFSTTNSWT